MPASIALATGSVSGAASLGLMMSRSTPALQEDVVGDAQRAGEREFLVDDGDPQTVGVEWAGRPYALTVEFDGAVEVGMDARQDLDQCAFAGPVLTGQDMHLARINVEIHAGENRRAAKTPGYVDHANDRRLCRYGGHLLGDSQNSDTWIRCQKRSILPRTARGSQFPASSTIPSRPRPRASLPLVTPAGCCNIGQPRRQLGPGYATSSSARCSVTQRLLFRETLARNAYVAMCALLVSGVWADERAATDAEVFGRLIPVRDEAPQGFPAFEFEGHDDDARVLSEFLWYHYRNRLPLGPTLFIQEYLSRSDLWLNANWKDSGQPIQEIYRHNLLGIRLDAEGYVHTHQHFSHAHEHGWPFPLWMQAGIHPGQVRGVTAGWHFQNTPRPGAWVWNYLQGWDLHEFHGDAAVRDWDLEACESQGIVDGNWRVVATGASPTLTTPPGVEIDAFNAPFLQLRWKRSGASPMHRLPYIEWLRADDSEYSAERRVCLHTEREDQASVTGVDHTMITMHRHALWRGQIKRLRLSLGPGESDVTFDINSLFTVYDTRHPINNPIFIFASANYFRWTGDLKFLHRQINRMRLAMRYMMTELGGLEHDYILNAWPGHDGIAGWTKDADGNLTMNPGHGIGNNYYDLLPFGWKDCYSTMQYYAALRCMADLEASLRDNPGWGMPRGALALDPEKLREHAARVKRVGNALFWNDETGRFNACIDANGKSHDYGLTWLGLEAIWYDFATPEHARRVMDWISGKRIVHGDTSIGADIYRWRFGPRVTTLRNVEWYGQGWISPELIPWGGQIQDGGGVLGFAFYDLYARLQVYGPDDAWTRLQGLLDWEREVWVHGGYRPYYHGGTRGTTLQGGGTAGGIGIDYEFYESSNPPSIIVYGFLGLSPSDDALRIAPRLPEACPRMAVSNVYYRGGLIDVSASDNRIEVHVIEPPPDGVVIELAEAWRLTGAPDARQRFKFAQTGLYTFTR